MAGRPLSIGPNRSNSSLHPASTGASRSTPRRKSHYRPFSSQSPYIDIATAQSPPSLRRSASVGGLHYFCNNMGLQFGSKGRKELARPNSPAVLPFVLDASSLRPTKKRSMVSIFASDLFTAPPPPSPKCSDELPVINISKDHVSSEELGACDRFMPKDIWAKRCNMKIHPYHKQVAYMQAYDPISLESHRYTDLLFQRLTNGSPSFHDYGKKPPAMVLDLGCGQGHWILHAANVWKNTEFFGLDIVDTSLPAFETVENVRLVRGDFVNYEFPFPDDTFDFVRMADLALCIPYDKWEFVLSQARRVLTPGGRLELIDDDIYFPYGVGSKGIELEALFPASPLCGTFVGDEQLDVDNETRQGKDTNDGDSMKPEATVIAGATNSTPVTSDSKFPGLHQAPSLTSHCFRTRKSSLSPASPHDSLSDTSCIPKTWSRSTTRHLVLPSSTTRTDGKHGNSSPPCPKRIKEKVALLPPIRSTTPALSLSSGYSPTWSLRTANTSPARSDASSIRSTDTSPSTSVGSVVNKVDLENSVWQKKVFASKNMESLFEKMLVEQYGIHPRPFEFMLRVLGKIFREEGNGGVGEAQVRMTKNFHIKLAPTETISDQSDSGHVGGAEMGHSSIEEADGMASTSTGMSSTFSTVDSNSKPQKQHGIPVTSLRSSPWQGQDKKLKVDRPRTKKEKDKDKNNKTKLEDQEGRQLKHKKTQAGAIKTTATMTVSLLKRSQPHDPASSNTPVNPALSAKAAGILGIPYSELSTVTLSLSLSSKKRRPPAMQLPCSFPSNLSAKAAGRLGIPYSEALSAVASLTVPRNVAHLTAPSSSSTFSPTTTSEPELSSNTTSGPVQHPGLLIWPDTHVPMAAGELEMHACKYIHTLLGCRPALEEFVAKFVDGRGDRFVGEEELRDEIWEYECFRRARFNWPSEAAEPYEDDPTNPNAAVPSSPGHYAGGDSTADVNHPTASTLDLPTTSSASPNGLVESTTNETFLKPTKSKFPLRSSSNKFCKDGFVHLRSIRVFEGIKAV